MLYGSSFFLVKFAIYAILLWMPLFLSRELSLNNNEIANLLTCYEVGTLIGTMTLGPLTDLFYAKRSPVAALSVICSSFIAFIIASKCHRLGKVYLTLDMSLLGFFLGSTYHIINITCCADLGKEQRGKQATSTISGIIDGMGSLGSGIGMLTLGYSIDHFGFRRGFLMVVAVAITLTLLPLGVVLKRDLQEISQRQSRQQGAPQASQR